MGLKKLIKVFCRICDVIRRFIRKLERPANTDHPTNNKKLDPNSGVEIKLDGTSSDQESSTKEIEKIEIQNDDQDTSSPETKTSPPKISEVKLIKPERKPKNIKGRRGESGKQKLTKKKETPPNPGSRPELICREINNQWQIFLVFSRDGGVDVFQGESKLSTNSNGEYLLLNFTQNCMANLTGNDTKESIMSFDDASPLCFKLRKNWNGSGRQVKHISNGHYVVFAPCDWKRKGNAPVEESECTDDQFSAHYFYSDSNNKSDGFVECDSFYSKDRFSLQGKKIADDSDMGDLFVGTSLELNDTNNWQDVSWISVGKEGGGKWREDFKPTKNLLEILGEREGWFYIRVYDKDVKMIDGFDFRRLIGLQEIFINKELYSPEISENIIVPNDTGHTETVVQFIGDNVSIENKRKGNGTDSYVVIGDNNTATIAPHPDADKTYWILNGETEAIIHLPRIWWRMNHTNKELEKWRSIAFEMSRDKFRDHQDAKIIIRLPLAVKKIDVGFDSFNEYQGAKNYLAKLDNSGGTKWVEFSLRDFCYHTKIDNPSYKTQYLRIQCDGKVFAVVRILADAPPPNLGLMQVPNLSQTMLVCPVTSNRRFSRGELDAAGLTVAEAKNLGIHTDRRRHTSYPDNIIQLQKLQGEKHAD